MLILAFFIVVESGLTGGKYECFDCMLTIERNKTVEQRGGPCLEPSEYEEPLTDRMYKGEIKDRTTYGEFSIIKQKTFEGGMFYN